MFESPSSITISTTFLGLLAISFSPWAAAAGNNITTDDLHAKINPTTALPGFNVDGGSIFTNYVDAHKNKQLFWMKTGSNVFERPESEPVHFSLLSWCSDLTFSDVSNSSLIGYAGRCVLMFLTGYANLAASGAQLPFIYSEGEFAKTLGISAVFVEQTNVFEGQVHVNTDDFIYRYWDDGRKSSPMIVWEGHDEGDMDPNAGTSSVSGFAEMTWMSVEEVAELLNTSVDDFTPETFKQVYLNTWIKDHEKEATEDNPFPESELAIIEQVKNETNSADYSTTTSVQPDSTADVGSDPVVIDDSGSGRQLASVAARFVAAALRVFGI